MRELNTPPPFTCSRMTSRSKALQSGVLQRLATVEAHGAPNIFVFAQQGCWLDNTTMVGIARIPDPKICLGRKK